MTGFFDMDEPQEIIGAHSAVEAYLHLLMTPCPVCGHGACEPIVDAQPEQNESRFHVTCANCGATDNFVVHVFVLDAPVDPISLSTPINPTRQSSRLLDVGQWLTAAELLLQSAGATPDAQEGWWRRCRAGECLDEALKFYKPDSELPPESAFWVDSSRAAVKEHPQRFTRERVIATLADLPKGIDGRRVSDTHLTQDKKRPWWRPW